MKADVVHLHDAWFMVVPIRLLQRKKKIIMHYHGSMIRANLKGSWRKKWEQLVDVILVSTPDLLEFDYEKQPYYIPNAIDTDLFARREIPENGKCYTSLKRTDTESDFLRRMERHGIKFDFDIVKPNSGYYDGIRRQDMPDWLSGYEAYADIPMWQDKVIKAHSVTGLEALSLGMKVINWNYEIETGLPDFHRPENVVKEVMKFYD